MPAHAQWGSSGPFPDNILIRNDGTDLEGTGKIIDLRRNISATYDSLTSTYHIVGVTASSIATFPPSPTAGDLAVANDGNSATDCTAGGGSTYNLCAYNGSAWTIVGDGTGGGSGSMTTAEEGDVQVGGADIVTLDFGLGLDITESPNTEINIVLDLSEIVDGHMTSDSLGNVGVQPNIITYFTTATPTTGDSILFRDATDGALKEGDVDDLIEFSSGGGAAGHGDGANCAAGEIALGVDGDGAVQGCYEPAEADISDLSHTTDQVGTLTNGDMCTNNGTTVECTVNTEAEFETAMDATNFIVSTEIDSFSELDDVVTDKALVNKADGAVWLGTHDFGGATLEIPNSASDLTLDVDGKIGLQDTDDQLCADWGAAGEVIAEACISAIRHLTAVFDPAGWWDQESTYRVVPLMTIGDDAPEGITIVEWEIDYVGGDPTTEFAGDLICDTTADYNRAAGATVMDVLDTTAGASAADSGFDSATCANAAKMYIDMDSDPTDANVMMIVDIYFYNEED